MAEPERADELRRRLWAAPGPTADDSPGASVGYPEALLEQYKLYVEMADRVSQRRALANTFFLTLNTAVFTLVAVAGSAASGAHDAWLVLLLLVLVAECATWFYVVRSYRQLNSAKFEVVGALEERLPASPYWRAEWWALGEGRDRTRYWPLSHVEQTVPVLFALAYVGSGAVLLLV